MNKAIKHHNSLEDWLSWLEDSSDPIDLCLDRVIAVAKSLALHHFNLPVITVAGTNGKGSTVTMLSHIYQKAGYHVATFTSPHLLDFKERLLIDQHTLSAEQWCEALETIDIACGNVNLTGLTRKDEIRDKNKRNTAVYLSVHEGGERIFNEEGRFSRKSSLSYFEFTFLAALWLIQQRQHTLDLIIIEVGLGGRLDATNIVDNDLAIITTIELDHQAYLGDTREAIGYEKAGIFRSHKPAICGDFDCPQSVREHAAKCNTRLYCQRENFDYYETKDTWVWHTHNLRLDELPKPKLPLQNASTALQAIYLLQNKLPLERDSIVNGLADVDLKGRCEYVAEPKPTLMDVAHNPHAGHYLAKQLQQHHQSGNRLAVIGMLNTKAPKDFLTSLAPAVNAWYFAPLNNINSFDSQTLAACVTNAAKSRCFDNISQAYQQAVMDAQPNDLIVVSGSFHSVGEVSQYLAANS